MFSAYLWGIETPSARPGICGALRPFSAYLWGIETPSVYEPAGRKGSFQPTYEELKPFRSIIYSCTNLCFQPTYEELKRFTSKKGILWCFGFQPTYEELKRFTSKKGILWCFGFQPTYEELKLLPSSILSFRFKSFSAYLWGIETWLVLRVLYHPSARFSAYLWGIETSRPKVFFKNSLTY